MEGQCWKKQDPDPDPDPVHTKMLGIRNTDFEKGKTYSKRI
jgi:hypothetical protein